MASPLALSALVLALLMCTSMAAPVQDKSVPVDNVTPLEEAQHIALDATEDILPNPQLVEKIMAAVAAIRSQQPAVAKVRNDGRWKLGQVDIEKLDQKLSGEISKSEYAPVKETIQGKDDVTTVVFTKPYNPDLLADELHTKYGVVVRGVWKQGGQPDFGGITYNKEDNTYTFRQGLDNCGPNCKENHFWVYKIDSNNKSTLDHEYATDIPIQYVG